MLFVIIIHYINSFLEQILFFHEFNLFFLKFINLRIKSSFKFKKMGRKDISFIDLTNKVDLLEILVNHNGTQKILK